MNQFCEGTVGEIWNSQPFYFPFPDVGELMEESSVLPPRKYRKEKLQVSLAQRFLFQLKNRMQTWNSHFSFKIFHCFPLGVLHGLHITPTLWEL